MKPDLQRRIQRYGWDQAAPHYETGWEIQLWSAQESLLSEVDPQPGGSVTGVDLSEGMIEEARSRAANKGIENVRFKHMDAEALDLPDNSFDTVICSLGLMYFPHPEKAIKEMYRVLKPGGQAAALIWGERSKCGWAETFPITDRRVQSEVCPLFFQLGTGATLSKAFEEAGFEELKSKRFAYDLHFRNDEQACTAAFLGGAVAYQKFDNEIKQEVHREYWIPLASTGMVQAMMCLESL